jgi:CopG family transcriptional regulator / antitoxin EndoAI
VYSEYAMKQSLQKTQRQTRRRINIMVSPETIRLLDRVAPKGGRSRLIDQAVKFFVEKRAKANLREELKQEALDYAERDRAIAEEWFSIDEEAWEKHGG